MHEIILFLAIYFIFISTAYSQTLNDTKTLRSNLFTVQDYDVTIKPRLDQSKPVDVNMSLSLTGFVELNEAEGKLVTTGYIDIQWSDELLTWSPEDYGGIWQIFVPQNLIWRPDLSLENEIEDLTSLGSEHILARIFYNGTVHWLPYQLFETNCFIDLTNYPYDTQNCHFKFLVWSRNKEDVRLYLDSDQNVIEDGFDRHGIWDISKTSIETVKKESESHVVIIGLIFQRRPAFYVINLIVPLVLLALLNKFTFVVPVGGDRIGYTVTAWLSYVVYLTLIATEFSTRLDSVPVLSIYLTIQIVSGTLIVILTLYQSRLAANPKEFKISKRFWKFCIFVAGINVENDGEPYKMKCEEFLSVMDFYFFWGFLSGYLIETLITFVHLSSQQ
ncbi:CHRNG [Mytilus coruscus]|uniref:CHRNG n=1 Tax=Mytilus coruscus TaxID=42192 RepID=A0A6J8BHE4_MYTCO|nr:CHRNG [Mytilus coruscus]